jgi:DNA transposition AAA+ family ATPase
MAISDENRARFEGIGFEHIKRDVATGGVAYLGIGTVRAEAKEWVEEQEAKSQREQAAKQNLDNVRFKTILQWTIIAAIASVIAAVTGIVSLFR